MHLNEAGVSFPISDEIKTDAADKLLSFVTAYGIDISEDACKKEIDYLEMMLEKNQFLNLTAVRDFQKGIILHLVDSLLYLKEMRKYCPFLEYDSDDDEEGHSSFVDMGCGAGLPGIPLAIADSSLRGVLCDSTKKKIAAVDEFIDRLSLESQLSTSTLRLEDLARSRGSLFPFALTRALSSLPTVLEYGKPFLAEDGVLIVSKGTPDETELRRAKRVQNLLGFELIEVDEFELPLDFGHRSIFVYNNVGESHVELPRAVGMATSSPLA